MLPVKVIAVTDEKETCRRAEAERIVYSTKDAQLAKRLCVLAPCIYMEETGSAPGYGVRFVYQGEQIPQDYARLVWHRHYQKPLTIARTKRLVIRESTAEDLDAFWRMYEEEAENLDVKPFSQEAGRELAAYIKHRYELWEYGLWTVVEKDSGRVIGRAGLEDLTGFLMEAGQAEEQSAQVELSYLFARECRGRGYAQEAAQAILDYAREKLVLKSVYVRTSAENQASRRLAEKLGGCLCGRCADGENGARKRVVYEIRL